MDKEPTEAQIKEFWERCGFKEVLSRTEEWRFAEFKTTNHWWEAPNGGRFKEVPPINLNNLFKYAVPKLDIEKINLYPATKNRWGCYFDEWYQDHNVAETPALALFWAIKEAMK